MNRIFNYNEGKLYGVYEIRVGVYLYIPLENKLIRFNSFKLLQSSNWLRKIYNNIIKFVGITPIVNKYIFKKVEKLSLNKKFLDELSNVEGYHTFAAYTGTEGHYHKVTLQLMDDKGCILGYAKIPLTDAAEYSIKNEYEVLKRLENINLEKIDVPKVIRYNNNVLIQSNNEKYKNRTTDLNNLIMEFFEEIYSKTKSEHIKFNEYEKIQLKMNYLEQQKIGLENEIQNIREELNNKSIVLMFTHKDFTSWNMKIDYKLKRLYVFDWEFGGNEIFGFDLFHFIFMQEVLVNKVSNEILIEKILNNEIINYFIKYVDLISIKQCFILYLINLIYFYHQSDQLDNKDYLEDEVLVIAIDVLKCIYKEALSEKIQ